MTLFSNQTEFQNSKKYQQNRILNKAYKKITSKERKEKRLSNPVALREAVINAIVHNDYTSEISPKLEFFDDRKEITSFDSLP